MAATSFSAAVAPLITLAQRCVEAPAGPQCAEAALASPVAASGAIALGLGVLCYVLSCITKNDSWVDRTWSIVPPAHIWFYVWFTGDAVVAKNAAGSWVPTVYGGFAFASTVWGIRLTYNFFRRGGYQSGGEDYRWEHVRAWPVWKNRLLWHLFSFWFISVFQQWLLWAITLPVLAAKPNQAASGIELAVMLAYLGFIAFEATADQQQWNFQNEKRKQRPQRPHLALDYKVGFLTHGLFARSRHPNVWAEQQIWLSLYAVSILRYGAVNWFGLGVLALVLLTVRSCMLTEQLSAAKYPQYRAFKRHVPMLVPGIMVHRKKLDEELAVTKKDK